MVKLNADQMTVLNAVIDSAMDATSGDFAMLDEVSVKGMNKHAMGAYLTQLQELNLITVSHTKVNMKTVGQITIWDDGWDVAGYNPHTKTKRALSPAVHIPSRKENTVANKNTGNAAKAQAEIKKLINRLVALKDKSDSEGRKIRRMLRKLGHRGGCGKVVRKAPKGKTPKTVVNNG